MTGRRRTEGKAIAGKKRKAVRVLGELIKAT
jgi:hypothetical protein